MGTVKSLMEWGVAAKPMKGEAESGDGHLVIPFPNGNLVGMTDGLGHGREAATATKIALSVLEGYPHESVISLMKRCHEALAGTRGVVMSLASFSALDNTLTWLGVGNVEGMILRAGPARESLPLRGGVVGQQLPPLRAAVFPVLPGDTLILATDGVRGEFCEGLALNGTPEETARRILTKFAKDTDDAVILVARYRGSAS